MSANEKAVAALDTLGKGFHRMGRGLELVAFVGAIYLGWKLWTCNYNIELIVSKIERESETGTKKETAVTCGDCNKKAVLCSTCNQKVCAVCKEKQCAINLLAA